MCDLLCKLPCFFFLDCVFICNKSAPLSILHPTMQCSKICPSIVRTESIYIHFILINHLYLFFLILFLIMFYILIILLLYFLHVFVLVWSYLFFVFLNHLNNLLLF